MLPASVLSFDFLDFLSSLRLSRVVHPEDAQTGIGLVLALMLRLSLSESIQLGWMTWLT